jgi:chemotaxis protein methyltransferase CheR
MDIQTLGRSILPENYRFLQQHVYSHVGIVLEEDKQYLFESRLAPIVKQLGLESTNDLCVLLHDKDKKELSRRVAEAMTTNETYFFREPNHYEAIRSALLPKLREDRQHNKILRFWSAAASTGQEAYSLAMLLLAERMGNWDIQILGTDFSSKVVERARAGLFHQIEVNRGLPASLLVKHFRPSGLDWQLSDAVRRMARFETIDLRSKMTGLGPFDLVLCRNVMIYFDNETKRRIMKEIHGTMYRGGWLLLGGSESVFGLDEWFERQTLGTVTVYVAR